MNWLSLLSSSRFGDKPGQSEHDKNRSRFEQDSDRIIFSQPFRMLQDKTQVFPMPEETFVHNRLTHSLEVSSVGRSLGKNAGHYLLEKCPELAKSYTANDFGSIVAAACLCHDIGNPPFGHAGEDGISAYFQQTEKGRAFESEVSSDEWADLIAFEGNAQGFRILNSPLYKGAGMTFASLGAFTKYPLSSTAEKEKGRKSQKKYGFYAGNREQFLQVADQLGLVSLGDQKWARHPLSFLMEAADDICYGIIDFEDGCRLGLIDFNTYKELLSSIIGSQFSEEKLERSLSLNEKLGTLRALAISQLIRQCSEAFKIHEEDMLTAQFDKALTDVIPAAGTLEKIGEISLEKIYRSRQVLEKEAGGYQIISTLMDAFSSAAHQVRFGAPNSREKTLHRLLPQEYQIELSKSESVYDALQLVTDYVSSLTDRYATHLYKTINGL